MLARFRKSVENKDSGFTLIELLVVMIIIGILAAIAIPAFLNQKAKAKETSAKADVTTIGKEIAAYYVDSTGGLVVGTTAASGATPPQWTLKVAAADTTPQATGKLSPGNTASGTITGDASYCVQVKNADAPTVWRYNQDGLSKAAC